MPQTALYLELLCVHVCVCVFVRVCVCVCMCMCVGARNQYLTKVEFMVVFNKHNHQRFTPAWRYQHVTVSKHIYCIHFVRHWYLTVRLYILHLTYHRKTMVSARFHVTDSLQDMGSPEGIYGYSIGQIFSSPYKTWTVYHKPNECDLHLHSSSLLLQF